MIGVDIDGVLADSDVLFREHLEQIFHKPFRQEDIYCFDIQKCFNLTDEQFSLFWDTFTREHKWEKIQPVLGARRVLKQLPQEEIMLMTARPAELKEATEYWLRKNKIPYAQLLFMEGKSKRDDVVSRGIKLDYFVEDRFEFGKDLADLGIKVLLLNYPWNVQYGSYANVMRVNNWEEIGRIIVSEKTRVTA